MLTLGELLVKTPEDADNGEGGGGDGIGEITTGGRDGTDDRDGTSTVGGAEAVDVASTLVELGEGGTEISGETRIGGHLSETTGDFSEGLGPARGGVSHHSDVLTLITEVLSEGDTGVDGGLSGSDGHVGGVGDEGRALHDVVLATVDLGRQLGEVIEDLSHLVAALTAADVDDDIGVRVLGESLRDTGLTAAEGTWNSAGTALDRGEESVQDALAGRQRVHGSELLSDGSGATHGPEMRHGDVLAGTIVGLNDSDGLLHSVVASRHDFSKSASHLGGHHDLMLGEEVVLEDLTNAVTADDEVANLLGGVGGEHVGLVLVEAVDDDATGDEDGLELVGDSLERSLNTVEDIFQNTGTEFDGKRISSSEHGIVDSQAS
mmetsp:Transcript_34292/g.45169  ORF Transcript_34292/g.45169 Transcript_34292/m.45169 type:complete len:377 (-) Transcript_34292:682-1812(-)